MNQSGKINLLVSMAIARSIKDEGTAHLQLKTKSDNTERLKNNFENTIAAWGGKEHEDLWTGSLLSFRWSITIEVIAE